MIGAEFTGHGSQQKVTMKIVSPDFPGLKGLGDSFAMLEEWYTFHKFLPDLHVILVQETKGMHDSLYQRPPYPATWARMCGKGRVFYTSMGHREDVWTESDLPADRPGRDRLGSGQRGRGRDPEHRRRHAPGRRDGTLGEEALATAHE